jgi:hypothetical protein
MEPEWRRVPSIYFLHLIQPLTPPGNHISWERGSNNNLLHILHGHYMVHRINSTPQQHNSTSLSPTTPHRFLAVDPKKPGPDHRHIIQTGASTPQVYTTHSHPDIISTRDDFNAVSDQTRTGRREGGPATIHQRPQGMDLRNTQVRPSLAVYHLEPTSPSETGQAYYT